MHGSNTRNHFIVYVRWDIILDWKKSEIQEDRLIKKEQIKPYAYGTGAKGIPKKIKKGDILWVLTIPKYSTYSSYPSLNAMMVIDEVIDQQNYDEENKLDKVPTYIKNYWDSEKNKGWRYVIIGDKDKSTYFPINNAYEIVVKKILKDKSVELEKKIAGEKFGYVAQHFQTIRKVTTRNGNALYNFCNTIKKSDTIFVSYRRGRGVKIVKAVVEALLMKKLNCWQDINRMPQDLSSQYLTKAEAYFNLELENAIKESSAFLAIKRKDYFNSKWTTLEYNKAKAKKTSEEYLFLERDLAKLADNQVFNDLLHTIEKYLQAKL